MDLRTKLIEVLSQNWDANHRLIEGKTGDLDDDFEFNFDDYFSKVADCIISLIQGESAGEVESLRYQILESEKANQEIYNDLRDKNEYQGKWLEKRKQEFQSALSQIIDLEQKLAAKDQRIAELEAEVERLH